MNHYNALENQTTRGIVLMACATALAVAFTVARPQPAHADRVTPPAVPFDIQVESGNRAFLVGHAVGTQNYICLPCPNPITPTGCPASGFAFALFTPQATLLADNERQVITHYFSPNLNPIPPEIRGTIRATWEDSKDTSTIWAQGVHASTDARFVAKGAVAWVLLKVVGAADGPTGGGKLTGTTFVQRLNTSGGVAPPGCDSLADVGKQAFVPYTADYFFYEKAPGN